ncbi:MAG: response regulator transcription factor [Solirubrobacteraceae bacterium]
MRLLIVEDNEKWAALIARGLRAQGFACDFSPRGEDAVWMAEATAYAALVIDVMLPGIDGFETCRRLRADEVWTPVLMLTALDAVEDRVAGLDGGADDYLTKPFALAELVARLRALIRRGGQPRPVVLEASGLRLDPAARRVWRAETEIALSGIEFRLLELLMRRAGVVVSRFELLEHGWDQSYENRSNIVDSYMHRLREKLDRPFGEDSIETVRGAGYRLREGGA